VSNTQIPVGEIQNYMRGLVTEKGWSTYKLSKKAGFVETVAYRFMRDKRPLTTENTLKAMKALGFEITLVKKGSRAATLFNQLLGLGSSDLVEIT